MPLLPYCPHGAGASGTLGLSTDVHDPEVAAAINISGMCMFHITDGKVTEWAEVFDQMNLMQQIGAIPTPGQEAQVATA